MKKLLKKSWFTGTLIMVLLVAISLINLWILSTELSWSYDGENLLALTMDVFDEQPVHMFGFFIKLAYFLTLATVVLSGYSIIRKNNWGVITAGLTFFAYGASLIAFQLLSQYLSLLAAILVIINMVLVFVLILLIILRSKLIKSSSSNETVNKEEQLKNSKIPLLVMLVNVLAVLFFLTTFFVPVYTWVKPGADYSAVLINSLLEGDSNELVIIYFFVNVLTFLGIFIYFSDVLANYVVNKEKYMYQSRKLVKASFAATAIFFLAGLGVDIFYTIKWGMEITTISYLPMLLMFIAVFSSAIFTGKYKGYTEVSPKQIKEKRTSTEAIFYIILLTAVTVSMLFLPIVKIDITSGAYIHNINLTGFQLLRDYPNLDSGYRTAAYLLVVMLISIGLCLIISLTSYLSKSKQFNSIAKFTAGTNVFFVFVVAISGYYFQIAREINKAIIADIADFYGYTIVNINTLEYEVGTDAIIALAASVFVLAIMFLRRVFDIDETSLIEGGVLESSSSGQGDTSSGLNDETPSSFDPCYSFTELDSQVEAFNASLKERKSLTAPEPTLNGLINFIVEYARNSRLHLSYTPEKIATFVAGLGASKLSILQGMSGTGKTSLPKIFSEAIFGNCDIIEVESSWKDKNELLGYYNEFSLKYTPKKFTIALYKAALNKEVFTFILLDEMNLSRIEYYFSDFLSLMENEEDQREIKLVNIKLSRNDEGKEHNYISLENGHTLKVPPNVWFIGTANRDESTFVISDKVYDRAHTMNFTKRAPKVRNYSEPIPKQYYDYQTMNNLFEAAKEKGVFDAENSELIRSIEKLLAPYNISFGNRILKQIEDFVNIYKECFANDDVESEAVEKILLSKVVAKLEVKTIEDKDKLVMEFEKLKLQECADFIKHLDED